MAVPPPDPRREDAAARRALRLRWAAWLGALALVTAAMLWLRESLDAAHVVLAYLLVVLGASARGGRALGLAISVAAFGCFNFFFVPPYHTLAVAEPLDWLVLVAFLVTSVVAAQLLARAQSEAAAARQRAAEVDRLSALGAEALNAGRAEDALAAMADVIRTTLDVARCDVYAWHEPSRAVALLAASGALPPWAAAAERRDEEARRNDARQDEERQDEERRDEERDDAARTWRPGAPSGARLVEWVAGNGRAAAERTDGTLRFDAGGGTDGTGSSGAATLVPDVEGASALLLPLRVHDRTVGVLRVMGAAALSFDAPRRRLLEALSYYAALGVERVRLAADAERAEALREADRLKNALLASVSHDLRTPLTTIKALAHDIRSDGDERAVTIEEEADRLNRFVADLLDLSRLAGGALAVAPEINAAEDLVGAALQRASGALGGRGVAVSLDPAEPLLLGRFDFVHALRVLVNLLENAHKYSPPGTAVEVAARRVGDGLELAVADRGPGVPPAERERIFEPFYRPAGSSPDVGGAGLGLSIARRLAEAQGGTLRYEAREGGGSRFVLRVPAADVAELDAGGAAVPARESL